MLHILGAQNLLKDVSLINDFSKYGFSYCFPCKGMKLHSWQEQSDISYGATYGMGTLVDYYFDFRFIKNDHSHLCLDIINDNADSDSLVLSLKIDPRFSAKKYARGLILNCAVSPTPIAHYQSDRAEVLGKLTNKLAINFMDSLANDEYKRDFDMIVKPTDKYLVFWTETYSKEDIMVTITDLCLHEKGNDCKPIIEIAKKEQDSTLISKPIFHQVIENVYFENNRSQLNDAELKAFLNKVKTYNLKDADSVSLIGFADTTGKVESNFILSQNRVKYIQTELSKAYPNLIVKIEALGELNDTTDLRKNRKVEIRFLRETSP